MRRFNIGGLGSCALAALAAFGACAVPEGAEFYTVEDAGAGSGGSSPGAGGSAGRGGLIRDRCRAEAGEAARTLTRYRMPRRRSS